MRYEEMLQSIIDIQERLAKEAKPGAEPDKKLTTEEELKRDTTESFGTFATPEELSAARAELITKLADTALRCGAWGRRAGASARGRVRSGAAWRPPACRRRCAASPSHRVRR